MELHTDTIQDQPEGVLGFHTEDKGGKLWGIVAAKPELDNGGKTTTGDWSVSSVLSHEVLEMYIDPNCNSRSNNGKGAVYSFEVCDPVEAPTYSVAGVSVSNFVTPACFDSLARFGPVRQVRPPPWAVHAAEGWLPGLWFGRQRTPEARGRVPQMATTGKAGPNSSNRIAALPGRGLLRDPARSSDRPHPDRSRGDAARPR